MQIQIDPSVRDLLHSNECASPSVGLIVGVYPENASNSSTPLKVLHLAQTNPAEVSDPRPTVTNLATSLLTHHIRSLLRMLPGGMNILGIYAISSSEIMSTPPKSLLNSLTKALSTKFSAYQPIIEPSIFLQFDVTRKKFEVALLDKDFKGVGLDVVFAESALLKVQLDFWLSGVGVQQEERGDKGAFFEVKEGVETVVKVWKEALQDASSVVTLFNGNLPLKTSSYVEAAPVSILVSKLPTYFLDKAKGRDSDFINHLHLRGKMHLIAYLNKGESTQRAEMALHADLLRSLSARLQLHCESLIEEDANIDSSQSLEKIVHELPRRVFVKLVKGKGEETYVCDYLFPGEGPRDCLESFSEVLGSRNGVLTEEDVVDGWEGAGDLESCSLRNDQGSMEQLVESIGNMQKKTDENSSLVWIGLVIALLAGLIAAVMASSWK